MDKKCFLVSGPSGVGKTSVIREITKQRPNIEKVITSTTREMRPEEKNGVDYYFYSKDEFERMLQNDDFFQSNMSYDNYYGSEKKEVARIFDSGNTPLFTCDPKNAEVLLKTVPNIVTIFIMPDEIENLRKRLEERDGSTNNNIDTRLKDVEEKIKASEKYNYIIINKQDELNDAIKRFLDIIDAETSENKELKNLR